MHGTGRPERFLPNYSKPTLETRTNTTVSSFQTTDTVLPMLPASAGATAAKVLACFFASCYLLNSPLGEREKKLIYLFNKNPAKDFCSEDRFPCVSVVVVLVANGSLDLAARVIVLQACLFHLAIQGAATEFRCAGQMNRARGARVLECWRVADHFDFFVSTAVSAS
jgi:hypothetical protein